MRIDLRVSIRLLFQFLFLATIAVPSATQAFIGGGSKGGGGGGAFACVDPIGRITTAISQDLFRARERAPMGLGLTTRMFYLADYRAIARSSVDRLAGADPVFASEVRAELDPIIAQVEGNRALVIGVLPVGDDHRNDLAPECEEGRSVFVQAAYYDDETTSLIVQSAVWFSFRSETDRAALLVHEAVYRVLRVRFGARDSVEAQDLTGRLFSVEPLRLGPTTTRSP